MTWIFFASGFKDAVYLRQDHLVLSAASLPRASRLAGLRRTGIHVAQLAGTSFVLQGPKSWALISLVLVVPNTGDGPEGGTGSAPSSVAAHMQAWVLGLLVLQSSQFYGPRKAAFLSP